MKQKRSKKQQKQVEWREVLSFPLYEVNNKGMVRRGTEILLKIRAVHYNWVPIFSTDGDFLYAPVSKLVLEAFKGESSDPVCFINGNSYDDNLSNLAYACELENAEEFVQHAAWYLILDGFEYDDTDEVRKLLRKNITMEWMQMNIEENASEKRDIFNLIKPRKKKVEPACVPEPDTQGQSQSAPLPVVAHVPNVNDWQGTTVINIRGPENTYRKNAMPIPDKRKNRNKNVVAERKREQYLQCQQYLIEMFKADVNLLEIARETGVSMSTITNNLNSVSSRFKSDDTYEILRTYYEVWKLERIAQ